MNVRVEIQFDPPDEEAWGAMRAIGGSLTNEPSSARVFALDDPPDWLVIEFTMPTEAQYKAVDKVDRAVRFHAWQRLDSTIRFPKSEAEQARARRKAQRCRARRQAAKTDRGEEVV